MGNVRSYTDKELLAKVKTLPSFKGWPETGVLDIWVRSNEDGFNVFDDKVYSFNCFGATKDPEFKMVCTGTTNAGQFGLKHFEKYNSKGCAVLKADILMYNCHVAGLHKGKDAYVQAKGFPYFRDNDRDDKAEQIGQEYNDIIGANCHRAGAASTVINDWSTACLVRNVLKEFLKWYEFMAKRKLSIVILTEF